MTKKIEAFMVFKSLINNDVDTINPIGELSPLSRTFSKRVGEYVDPNYTGVLLTTFTTTEDDTYFILPSAINSHIHQVCFSIYNHCRSNPPPLDTEGLLAALEENIDILDVSNVQFGEAVSDSSLTMPAWVSWTSSNHGSDTKIWFSDESFQETYQNYEIVVVPPVADLNVFQREVSYVHSAISTRSLTTMMRLTEEAKQKYPPTHTIILEVEYKSPSSGTLVNTNWFLLIYGNQGNHVDAHKDAIIKYLESNTEIGSEEWESYFPDLYKRTELIILPNWGDLAIPTGTALRGIYNTVTNVDNAMLKAIQSIDFLPITHIKSNLNVLPFNYKWMSLSIINGLYNKAGENQLKDIIPDYIPAATTSVDFSRMKRQTQEWVTFMLELLLKAEDRHHYQSSFPVNIITRGNTSVKFVSAQFLGVNHLVKVNE